MFQVSTPSRLCLFGEHQDYLGLEVIASAIDLRFTATVTERDDDIIHILIRDSSIDSLNAQNHNNLYQEHTIDLKEPITYRNTRDYLNSSVNLLLKNGYELRGADIKMDSEIPIGKGMCSSSTMIIVLIKALLERIGHPDKDDVNRIAYLGFAAEVLEFNEPGGMMDHYTSAIGGLVHLDFRSDVTAERIDREVGGCFILFDSLQQKDTTKVLAASKIPTLAALEQLKPYGISSVRDFYEDENKLALLEKLDDFKKRKLTANINNYRILQEALALLREPEVEQQALGRLIYQHQVNLRDGLGISTDTIDRILDTAMNHGALGGKVNGSGGGGCLYAYARTEDAPEILEAVTKMGYPAKILKQDSGVRREDER